jgi:hypothetical protein
MPGTPKDNGTPHRHQVPITRPPQGKVQPAPVNRRSGWTNKPLPPLGRSRGPYER